MTTNQTINGVSRKMLTTLLCKLDEFNNRALAEELRALLDAPAPVSDGVNWKAVANEQMGIIQALKAAQPQGGPVYQAWQYENNWMDVTRQEFEAHPNSMAMRKLYAEQPAPVAVVLPSVAYTHTEHCDARFNAGWNACLDEVKRLNPCL